MLKVTVRHFNLLEDAFMGPKAVVWSHKHPTPPAGDNLEIDLNLWRPLEVVSCFEKLAEPIFIRNGLN